ncbi:hypothetical protein KXV85_004043, partial [Aspergillus fumigatus]
LRQQHLRRNRLHRRRVRRHCGALSAGNRSCPRRQDVHHRVPELGLAHSVPRLRDPARHLRVDPAAAERIAGVPEDEGRGQELQGAADRSVRQLEQRQDRAARAVRRRDGPGRGLVHGPVLRAGLHAIDPQGRCLHRQPADRLVAAARHRLLRRVRRAVRQDRPPRHVPGHDGDVH